MGAVNNEKYFCSELIAKAFKILKAIDPNKRKSSQYFPGSFASAHLGGIIDEDLVPEVALSPVINVLVNPNQQLEQDLNLNHSP